jgi:hypothetical protein
MSELERTTVEPVRASVGMGFKRNVGNFENMDIHVSLSASALPGETAEQTFDRVYAFVEEKFVAKFEQTEKELREAGLGKER